MIRFLPSHLRRIAKWSCSFNEGCAQSRHKKWAAEEKNFTDEKKWPRAAEQRKAPRARKKPRRRPGLNGTEPLRKTRP
ncbi:MAG: hypothetical protein ACO1NM_08390 [Sphingobium phenoxybenzoativorans]